MAMFSKIVNFTSKKNRRLLSCLLFLLLAAVSGIHAQDVNLEDAFTLIDSGRYVSARELAEQELRKNRNSIIGNYLMGVVMHRGEVNLPLARYYLGRTRTLIERSNAANFDEEERRTLYLSTLVEILRVAQLMDKRDEHIRIIGDIASIFGLDYGDSAGWSLMKMGRYEEARELMKRYLESDDPDVQNNALNTLGAIEWELGNYDESFEWFTFLVKNESSGRANASKAMHLHNRAEAAVALLRFQEAEKDLLTATGYFHSDASNPWMKLAVIYTGEGRLAEALSALQSMHKWNRRADPALEQQRWNEGQQTAAIVLMAAGYNEEALEILRKIRNRPDRRGLTSGSTDQAEIGLLYLYREALQLRREHLREEMSWNTVKEWGIALGERFKTAWELWEVNNRLNALIVPKNRLLWMLRPYSVDSPLVEWMRTGLHGPLGNGLTQVELTKLLARTGKLADRERSYLRAALGETLAAKSNYRSALPELLAARKSLPREEVLLLARVEALIAHTQERLGDGAAAATAYRNAMERDPGILRALNLSLPVTFASDDSAAAKKAIGFLEKSPRFHSGRGFRLTVTTSGNRLFARLTGSDGAVLSNVSIARLPDNELCARLICREIHRRVFAPKFDLTQTDINSLDGSTSAGDANTLKEMLGIK